MILNGCTLNWVQPFLLGFFGQCRMALAVAGERDYKQPLFVGDQSIGSHSTSTMRLPLASRTARRMHSTM